MNSTLSISIIYPKTYLRFNDLKINKIISKIKRKKRRGIPSSRCCRRRHQKACGRFDPWPISAFLLYLGGRVLMFMSWSRTDTTEREGGSERGERGRKNVSLNNELKAQFPFLWFGVFGRSLGFFAFSRIYRKINSHSLPLGCKNYANLFLFFIFLS